MIRLKKIPADSSKELSLSKPPVIKLLTQNGIVGP